MPAAARPPRGAAPKKPAASAGKPPRTTKPAQPAKPPRGAKPARAAAAKTSTGKPARKTKNSPAPTPKKASPKTGLKAAPKTSQKAPLKGAGKPRRRTSRAPRPVGLEALYSGKVFRSRLEARWAIFLDLMEINWDYEPSHYQVGPELFYLPDFYLPEHRLWLEVKGSAFMDAQSVAKCLAAVAGPNPLPLREAPYTAADRLVIGGSMHPRAGYTPQHTLVTRAGAGKAGLSYATFGRGGIQQAGPNWDVMEATGVAKARRPAPTVIASLVEPPQASGTVDAEAHRAYRVAANIAFDDSTKTLARSVDPELAHRLGRRRSGRPLGPFLVPQALAA